jgi:hypothetical protein
MRFTRAAIGRLISFRLQLPAAHFASAFVVLARVSPDHLIIARNYIDLLPHRMP